MYVKWVLGLESDVSDAVLTMGGSRGWQYDEQ